MYNYESYLTTQPKLDANTLHHGMAYLAKLPLIKGASGLISPSKTIEAWVSREDRRYIQGIVTAFRTNSRIQLFTGKQTTDPYKRFNKLVPLVLSAFKEYNGIGYANWDWRDEKMQYLLDEDFQKLIPYIVGEMDLPQFEQSEVLEMLQKIDVDKYTVTRNDCPELYGYPILYKHMILQSWVCKPTIRHNLMICNIPKLDTLPESLYGDLEVFKKPEGEDPFKLEKVNPANKKKVPASQMTELPWEEDENAKLERELWGDK